jgi:hypothetical protein
VCGLKQYYSARLIKDDKTGGTRSLNRGYREMANSMNLKGRDVLGDRL